MRRLRHLGFFLRVDVITDWAVIVLWLLDGGENIIAAILLICFLLSAGVQATNKTKTFGWKAPFFLLGFSVFFEAWENIIVYCQGEDPDIETQWNFELVKFSEVLFESIPGGALQLFILITRRESDFINKFSVVMSVMSVGYGVASIFGIDHTYQTVRGRRHVSFKLKMLVCISSDFMIRVGSFSYFVQVFNLDAFLAFGIWFAIFVVDAFLSFMEEYTSYDYKGLIFISFKKSIWYSVPRTVCVHRSIFIPADLDFPDQSWSDIEIGLRYAQSLTFTLIAYFSSPREPFDDFWFVILCICFVLNGTSSFIILSQIRGDRIQCSKRENRDKMDFDGEEKRQPYVSSQMLNEKEEDVHRVKHEECPNVI